MVTGRMKNYGYRWVPDMSLRLRLLVKVRKNYWFLSTLKFNSHAVGMAVAQQMDFEIDFSLLSLNSFLQPFLKSKIR